MKAKYPDTVLLFRLGDFYETFDDDAKITSKVLGITLTKRGNGSAHETPLAGFPHHALESYLPKLLKAGYRVAVCEQLEDPKFAKGLVKRDVIEVVTPGVAFSDTVLEKKRNNYLLAIALASPVASADSLAGVAFIDVTTAEFHVAEMPLKQLLEFVAALAPSEVLVQKRDLDAVQQLLRSRYAGIYSKLDDWTYHHQYAYDLLTAHFQTTTLKGFGIETMTVGTVAAGAALAYLQETQKTNLAHLRRVVPFHPAEFMTLDPSTQRNLEISKSMDGRDEGTLYAVLDRTLTPMGGRLLRTWIGRPLRSVAAITSRLDAVEELTREAGVRSGLQGPLSSIGDLERLIARICTNRSTPRDIAALRSGLARIEELRNFLRTAATPPLREIATGLDPLTGLGDTIGAALADNPPAAVAVGGVFRKGYNGELDELRDAALAGKSWIARLQQSERERTGIASLKVNFNNVFGYYIEITNTHKEKVPADYIRKQTMVNAERYITPGLKEVEDKILHAEERILALELRLFDELRTEISRHAEAVQTDARLVAALDCYLTFATAAVDYGYVRPSVDDGDRIAISGGRHPVIERLMPAGEHYTPNDLLLDTAENQILIITGPNMSGKSSYLRQAGLIVLMAQIGSFVPAAEARIGIVDRIYTRVGASDNIASGESTFMVEMHEAAHIVNTATAKSLILLDEVGRGTSTFDGISIAWALTEYLHNRVGAKTLFATHYHELNELAERFPRIKNLKVEVREYGDKVIFLHKVTPGFADHSYGIQVAQMAGLPAEITERAKGILSNLENSELRLHDEAPGDAARRRPADVQMTLFEMKDDRLREELNKLDIEKLTPLEALQKLAEWKKANRP